MRRGGVWQRKDKVCGERERGEMTDDGSVHMQANGNKWRGW